MSTVSAYAATSATEPLTKTTIERRDLGPHDVAIDIKFAGICHSDIHTVNAEWGEPNYPIVARPRDRRRRHRGRLRGHQVRGRRPRRRRLLRRLLPRVQQLQGRPRAVLQTRARSSPTTPSTRTAPRPRAATATRSSSTRTTCCASPTRCRSTRRRRCCARASRSTRRCGTGARARASGSRSSAWAASGHVGVKLAAAMGAEVTRALPVAEEDGGRAAARRHPLLRDQRPRHLQEAARQLRPDPEHRLGQPRPRRLPGPARRRRHARRTRHPRAPDGGAARSRWRWHAAACPAR